MNRTAILLLALAIVLAHMVAIHQTPDGTFAPPYDVAHVAFRIGRNLVHDGVLAWNPGEGVHPSYPSVTWIALAALAEQLYFPPTIVAQVVGMLCTLGCVVALTQFSSERRVGLVAPLLLAVSGCAAAAGTSGTEASLAMLLVTTTMLSFERRWAWAQAISGALLVATRPAASWFSAALLLLELLDRPRDADGRRLPRRLVPALVPFAVLTLFLFLRRDLTGRWLSPTTTRLVTDPFGDLGLGLSYLRGFFVASGSAPLVLIPVAVLLSGKLSGVGRRSLVLAAAWALAVAAVGGDDLPFWNALAPVLPPLFLSIQEAVTGLMDRRRALQPVIVAVLALCTMLSLVVSKVPGGFGPVGLEALHRRWMEPTADLRRAFDRTHGRLGLLEEIRHVQRLRALGIFMRDRLPQTASIGTAWPGCIGYLSRRPVHDLLGRTDPAPGRGGTEPWNGLPHVALEETLARGDDYLVPVLGTLPEDGTPTELVRAWLARHGSREAETQDPRRILQALSAYEVVSVPVPAYEDEHAPPSPVPFLVLRKRSLGLTPKLELTAQAPDFTVRARHAGHRQIVDLGVSIEAPDGVVLWMRPTGEWVERPHGVLGPRARTDVMLFETGPRPVTLLHGRAPPGSSGGLLRVQLLDPSPFLSGASAAIGPPRELRLEW